MNTKKTLNKVNYIKNLATGVRRASGLVNTWGCWEGGTPGEGMETVPLSPYLGL